MPSRARLAVTEEERCNPFLASIKIIALVRLTDVVECYSIPEIAENHALASASLVQRLLESSHTSGRHVFINLFSLMIVREYQE